MLLEMINVIPLGIQCTELTSDTSMPTTVPSVIQVESIIEFPSCLLIFDISLHIRKIRFSSNYFTVPYFTNLRDYKREIGTRTTKCIGAWHNQRAAILPYK